MKRWMGIDPGASGGIAVLDQEHKLETWKMPETERDISDIFEGIGRQVVFTMIESVHSMPKQGVSSSFTFGRNYGFLRGMLIAHKIAFQEVSPQKWQRALGIPTSRGRTKTEHKNILKSFAQQFFPSFKFTLATADAALIAEYVYRRQFQGGGRLDAIQD